MIYDVDYFINKFEAIPDDKWCTGQLTSGRVDPITQEESILHCAFGHCGLKLEQFASLDTIAQNKEAIALQKLFTPYDQMNSGNNISLSGVVLVNDGIPTVRYDYNKLGTDPKSRILAALHLIKNGTASIK